MNYTWPGNVRELENAIERATVMCQGETIEREHFPLDLRANIRPAGEDELENGDIQNLPKAVERLERRLLVNALNQTKGNKRKASQLLGVTERMLGYKVKQYGLA